MGSTATRKVKMVVEECEKVGIVKGRRGIRI